MRAIVLALLLAGCTSSLARVEEVGSEGLGALEDSSGLAVKACTRYLSDTARVGPLLDWLDTEEKRNAWLVLFGDTATPLP